jgi:hypothetical protein
MKPSRRSVGICENHLGFSPSLRTDFRSIEDRVEAPIGAPLTSLRTDFRATGSGERFQEEIKFLAIYARTGFQVCVEEPSLRMDFRLIPAGICEDHLSFSPLE